MQSAKFNDKVRAEVEKICLEINFPFERFQNPVSQLEKSQRILVVDRMLVWMPSLSLEWLCEIVGVKLKHLKLDRWKMECRKKYRPL